MLEKIGEIQMKLASGEPLTGDDTGLLLRLRKAFAKVEIRKDITGIKQEENDVYNIIQELIQDYAVEECVPSQNDPHNRLLERKMGCVSALNYLLDLGKWAEKQTK